MAVPLQLVAEEGPRLYPLASLLEGFDKEAAAAHAAFVGNLPRGPLIGFPQLATDLGGSWPPGLTIIHGQAGTGKTAWGLQAGADAGCPALYVTAEMAPLELLRRITARLTNQYLGRFRTGEFSAETAGRFVRAAIAQVPQMAIADATQAWATPEWIQEAARSVRGSSPHLLIVVDSLHSWAEGAGVGATEYETLNEAIAQLRRLGSVLSCSVLAIAERNRLNMKAGGLSAGAGTRKIEYGAEAVLDLSCEEEARFDVTGEKPVELRIVKNRHGICTKVPLRFHGALQRFKPA